MYKDPIRFDGEFAEVKRNDKIGYIDKSGKEIVPCVFNKCKRLSDGSFLLETSYTFFKDDPERQEHEAKLYGYAFPDGTITFDEGTMALLEEQAYSEEIDRKEAQAQATARAKENYEKREKERIQRLKDESQWLQGEWVANYDSPAGRIASYTLTIKGDYARLKRNGSAEDEGEYTYDGSILKFASRSLRVNAKRHIIFMSDNVTSFTKISGVPAVSNENFLHAQQVMAYLSGKEFYGGDGTSLRIEPNGLYKNGSLVMSGAPVVKKFNKTSALIEINMIPSGRLLITVLPGEGRIVVNSGTSYYRY